MAELSIPARAQGAVADKRAHRGFEVPRLRTSVLVIGGGPTGATLALGLGRRGVCTVLVDASEQPLPGVRAGGASSRTMEVMRAIGVADDIRARAPSAPGGRAPRSSRPDCGARCLTSAGPAAGPGEATQPAPVTPEVFQTVPSFVLESVIREHIARCPHVTTLDGLRFVGDLEQTSTEVTARFVDNDGFPVEVTAHYAVATEAQQHRPGLPRRPAARAPPVPDPLHHRVRRPRLRRCPWPRAAQPVRRPQRRHARVLPAPGHGQPLDPADRGTQPRTPAAAGRADIVRTALGGPVGIEWAAARQWQANAFYAGKARVGRIFLAGDAAHAGPPGHLGLQQGVTDAAEPRLEARGGDSGLGRRTAAGLL